MCHCGTATFVDVYGRRNIYLFLSEHTIDFSLRIFKKKQNIGMEFSKLQTIISVRAGVSYSHIDKVGYLVKIFFLYFEFQIKRDSWTWCGVICLRPQWKSGFTWSQLYSEKFQVEAEHLDLLIIFAFLPSSLAFKLGFIRVPNRSRKFDQNQGKLSR